MFTQSRFDKSRPERLRTAAIWARVLLLCLAIMLVPGISLADMPPLLSPISWSLVVGPPIGVLIVLGLFLAIFAAVCFAGLVFSRRAQRRRRAGKPTYCEGDADPAR